MTNINEASYGGLNNGDDCECVVWEVSLAFDLGFAYIQMSTQSFMCTMSSAL